MSEPNPQEKEHPGLQLMRVVVRQEMTALTEALRSVVRQMVEGITRVKEAQEELNARLIEIERGLTINVEQIVELRKSQQRPTEDPDEWWKRGGDSSE